MISSFLSSLSNVSARNFAYGTKLSFSSLTIPLDNYVTHRLEGFTLPTESKVTSEELLALYKNMQIMRKMEQNCEILYKQKEIKGFCHTYDGQEGVISGIEAAVTHDDPIITSYRCHCHAYTRGDTPYQIFAEMMGRISGSSGGKGGSMHFYKKKNNFYGGHSIVGAQVPMGAGLAFALKYKNLPNVAVAMYGDGASNQGQVKEAANMAGLWSLPVLFVCENNQYGMATTVSKASFNTELFTRGDKVPGFKINGNNYFHVKEGFKWAKEYAIKNGPLFIEVQTFRYHGHSVLDTGKAYRKPNEVQEYIKNKDCINLIGMTLLKNNLATQDQLDELSKQATILIEQSIEKARKDPYPGEEELYTQIYSNNQKHYFRGVEFSNGSFPDGKKF